VVWNGNKSQRIFLPISVFKDNGLGQTPAAFLYAVPAERPGKTPLLPHYSQ
jgi:hypothetical protein